LPQWIRPQLTQLVDAAPDGPEWLHEIKFDGYRMHARLDRGAVRLLTRTGLDWTHKYPAIADAVASINAGQAYLDGELCGVRPDGVTSFSMIQLASDSGNAAELAEPKRSGPCPSNRQDAAGNHRRMQRCSPEPCRRGDCAAQARWPD
jgi:bifunctional non-homologous end joining protein LigD